jgi:hypothetical protein
MSKRNFVEAATQVDQPGTVQDIAEDNEMDKYREAARKWAEARGIPANIDINSIVSVYSGKGGWCCCGCAGKHTYSSQHRARVSTERGYEIPDDQVNDRVVKRIVSKIKAHKERGEVGLGYFSCVIGRRIYIAYFAM